MSADGEPRPAPSYDKAARQAERARVYRLSRLPPLYDFAQQGRLQAGLALLLQTLAAFVVGLVPLRLVTGDWLPRGAAVVVLLAALGVQALSRYLNARAGRT